MTVCRTCPSLLSHEDLRLRVVRCRPCRQRSPGQVLKPKPHARQHITIAPSRRTVVQEPASTSWWITPQSRDQFMATAREESLKVKKRELVLKHAGFGDGLL